MKEATETDFPGASVKHTMSGFTGVDDEEFWRLINNILGTIPLEENRETILRYVEERYANGIKPATCGVDANALRALCVYLNQKRLEDVTKQDIIGYVNHARQIQTYNVHDVDGKRKLIQKEVRLSRSTLEKRKEVIKPFFRWLRGMEGKDYPPEVRSLKSKKGDGDLIPTSELITASDLKAMIQSYQDLQAKARLAVLYETGFRAGEFSALNIGSVQFDKYGATLTLPKGVAGLKTGARRVRVFDCVPYLHAWYEVHARKNEPEAPLWYTMSHRAPGARLKPTGLYNFCQDAARGAGLKKHVHPHLFRHSAATERARAGWNEAQMRAFFGWSRSSDMPSRYVHLAGQDYERIELERRGLLTDDSMTAPALRKLVCRVCKTENPATNTFCFGCRNPVSPEAEAAIEAQRQKELADAAMLVVAKMTGDAPFALAQRLASSGGEAAPAPKAGQAES